LLWDNVYSTSLAFLHSTQHAEDVSQEVFITLWHNRHKASEIENLKAYLATIIKFNVYNRLRHMKVEQAYQTYLLRGASLATASPELETSLVVKDLEKSLNNGIAQMPPQQQKAFRLSRENGLTHEEISQVMGVSRKTVKDYIVRAIASLRPLLGHYGSIALLLAGSF
jgi:RNA polymerase sigma-70 factor (ECF subfamily)